MARPKGLNSRVEGILRDCTHQPRLRARTPAALHDFRTSTRRLQAALSALEGLCKPRLRVLRHQISSLRKKTNRARDREVLLEIFKDTLSFTEFQKWTIRHPSFARPECHGNPGFPESNQLRKLLSSIDQEVFSKIRAVSARKIQKTIREEIGKQSTRLRRLSSKIKKDGLTQESIHPTRIQAKKLRYELELFGWLTPDSRKSLKKILNRLREIQDLLGELHDLDMAIGKLREDRMLKRSQRKSLVARLNQKRNKISRSGLRAVKKLNPGKTL